MVAHLDAVTCLTTDPKGTYLISGSEYFCVFTKYIYLTASFCFDGILVVFSKHPALLPLQATTALCACGCWTTGRACRRSPPTGRSTTRPFTTWPSTPHSPSLPALAPMHLPRSSCDGSVVILVRSQISRKNKQKGKHPLNLSDILSFHKQVSVHQGQPSCENQLAVVKMQRKWISLSLKHAYICPYNEKFLSHPFS